MVSEGNCTLATSINRSQRSVLVIQVLKIHTGVNQMFTIKEGSLYFGEDVIAKISTVTVSGKPIQVILFRDYCRLLCTAEDLHQLSVLLAEKKAK